MAFFGESSLFLQNYTPRTVPLETQTGLALTGAYCTYTVRLYPTYTASRDRPRSAVRGPVLAVLYVRKDELHTQSRQQ